MTLNLLAGDIGGTNARLVLYEANPDPDQLLDLKTFSKHKVVSQMYYKNNDFSSFTRVLASFTSLQANAGREIHACCLATAGPVANNRINFTNREGWIIDGRAIQEEFGIKRVKLVNDFVANGYGLLGLDDSEVVTLQKGSDRNSNSDNVEELQPKALIGAGTGLGECFLTAGSDGLYQAFASEGGHVEFAPRTPLEEDLLHYLQDKLDLPEPDEMQIRPRISVERVVSGKGLENIYEFLREKFPEQVNPNLDADYNESSERGRLIGSEKYNYPLFKQALEMMFAVYGGEAGNVVLKFLPFGGLYIAGGIAPKNIEFIDCNPSEFMKRFLDKGRMRSIMSDIPVHVVMKEDLGLRGAHIVAARLAATDLLSSNLVRTLSGNIISPDDDEIADAQAQVDQSALGKLRATAKPDTLSNAIHDYPVTYAVASSITAALTASAIVIGGQFINGRGRNPSA